MDDVIPRPRRAKRAPAPTTPDPIEIAMEAEASGVAAFGEASLLLADQRRLIRAELMQRRALLAAFVLGALIVAGVFGAMVWNATQADGLTIEAFESPPDLQQQGFPPELRRVGIAGHGLGRRPGERDGALGVAPGQAIDAPIHTRLRQ